MKFDYHSGDGPMSLIFEGDRKRKFPLHTWKYTSALSMPIGYYALLEFGMQYWLLFPALLTPSIYLFRRASQARIQYENHVRLLWVLKNGDQAVLQTYDGLFHKVAINQTTGYLIKPIDQELLFRMVNCGRNFEMSNKNA